jgi:hypothetical protein
MLESGQGNKVGKEGWMQGRWGEAVEGGAEEGNPWNRSCRKAIAAVDA